MKPPIRVLVVFSSGDVGGAETSLTRMALADQSAAIEYTLATLGSGTAWCDWASGLGAKPKSFAVFQYRHLGIAALARFVRFCRELRPHIVYMVGMRAAVIVRLLRRFYKDAVLVHAVRSSFPEGNRLTAKIALTERVFGSVTDHYVANSSIGGSSLSRAGRIPQSNVTVIHNGIAASQCHARPQPDHVNRIVVVANINQYKGHHEFLAVVEKLRCAVPAVEVLFVGRDELAGAVQREITRRSLESVVNLVGYVADPEEFLERARVVALPSRQVEGCPTAVLEAMAMGRPVVAYRVGGLPELISSGVNGLLVEPDDQDAFATALERLLLDREMNEKFGRAARQTVLQEFTIDRCAERHAQLWHFLHGRRDARLR